MFRVGRLAWVTFVVLEVKISVVVTRSAEVPAVATVATVAAVLDEFELALEVEVEVEVEFEVAVVERILSSSGGGAWKVSSVGIPHPPLAPG